MRVAIIGSTGGWHAERLERAFTARGHECAFAPVTRMVSRVSGAIAVGSRDVALEACDVVIVRGIPRGSLEQIVYRVDALHALTAAGVRVVNDPFAIERAIDKFLASALVAAAGLPTPRPVACERAEDARAELCVRAAAALGADYAGVDLLRAADGRDYVIEVNAIPGWHGVEAATGVDVAGALVEHLERGA